MQVWKERFDLCRVPRVVLVGQSNPLGVLRYVLEYPLEISVKSQSVRKTEDLETLIPVHLPGDKFLDLSVAAVG